MSQSNANPPKFTWTQYLVALIVVGLLFSVPEWTARRQVETLCNSFQVGKLLEPIKQNTGFHHDGKPFSTCGFKEDTQSGAVFNVALGWFPLGRDFCVVTLNNRLVVGRHVVYGSIDYDCDQCRTDIRPFQEIDENCK